MRKKALIAIDASNLKYYLKEKGWRIDWRRFKTYLANLYEEIRIIYYEGIRSKASFFDFKPNAALQDFIKSKDAKSQFFKDLKTIGYKVVSKVISRVYDHTDGTMKHKCNFDVEITINAIDQMDTYDEFILCSGDGDFVKLLKYLKGHRKKTIVVAPKKRLSDILAKTANRVIFLEDVRTEIEGKQK